MRTVEKMHHWHCNQREYDSTTSSNKHNKTQSGKRKNYNIAIIAIITTQSGHLNRDKKTHLGENHTDAKFASIHALQMVT